MAENQASSQSPIFFRLVEDGNCRSLSDIEYPCVLDIPVPKSLVIWVSPLRDPENTHPASDDKPGESKVIFRDKHLQSTYLLIQMLC